MRAQRNVAKTLRRFRDVQKPTLVARAQQRNAQLAAVKSEEVIHSNPDLQAIEIVLVDVRVLVVELDITEEA